MNDSRARQPSQPALEGFDLEVCCPLCGRPARHRGQRNRTGVFECTSDACLVTIFEAHDPSSSDRRGGRP